MNFADAARLADRSVLPDPQFIIHYCRTHFRRVNGAWECSRRPLGGFEQPGRGATIKAAFASWKANVYWTCSVQAALVLRTTV